MSNREEYEPRLLVIDDDMLDYPICDCGVKLTKVISGVCLTSYPPYREFKCDNCDFKGFRMLANNGIPLEKWEFSTDMRITNEKWILALKSLLDHHGKKPPPEG